MNATDGDTKSVRTNKVLAAALSLHGSYCQAVRDDAPLMKLPQQKCRLDAAE